MPAIPYLKHLVGVDDQAKPAPTLPALALAGGGAAAGTKAFYDIGKLQEAANNWENQVKPLVDAMETGKAAPADYLRAMEHYSERGSDLLNHRILGLPVPRSIVRYGNPLVGGTAKALVQNIVKQKNIPFLAKERQAVAKMLTAGLENMGLTHESHPGLHSIPYIIGKVPAPDSPVMGPTRDIQGVQKHYDLFAHGSHDDKLKHLLNLELNQPEFRSRLSPATAGYIDYVESTLHHPDHPTAHQPFVSYLNSLIKGHSPESKAPTWNLAKAYKSQQGQAVLEAFKRAARNSVEGPNSRLNAYSSVGRKVILPGLRGLTGTAMALSALPLLKQYVAARHVKDAAANDDTTEREHRGLNEGALGGGLALGAHGIHTLARPLDVGVTWGAVPSYGAGHKEPGQALRNMLLELQKRKDLPEFRLTDVVRTARPEDIAAHAKNPTELIPGILANSQPTYMGGEAAGTRNVLGHTFDTMFDTGMGAGVGPKLTRDFGGDTLAERVFHQLRRPRSRLGGHVSYMTDLPGSDMTIGFDTAHMGRYGRGTGVAQAARRILTPNLFKDTSIIYGPEDLVKPDPLAINYRVNRFATPLIGSQNLQSIRTAGSKQQIISDLLANPKKVDIDPISRQTLQNMLTVRKPTLVITGSGRGDFVAHQALQAYLELKKTGQLGKVNIVAAVGQGKVNKHSPMTDILMKVIERKKPEGFAVIGFAGGGMFPKIPMIGDLHQASAGTSSFFETLASPAAAEFPTHLEKVKEDESRMIMRRLARKTMPNMDPKAREQLVRNMSLAELENTLRPHHTDLANTMTYAWNRGNREMGDRLADRGHIQGFGTQPGRQRIPTAFDINTQQPTHFTFKPGGGQIYGTTSIKDTLENLMSITPRDAMAAESRGRFYAGELEKSKKVLRRIIPFILRRQQGLKNVRGGAALATGLGLAGIGGYNLYNQHQRNQPWYNRYLQD